MTQTAALEVHDLTKTYGTGASAVRALAGVSLVLGTGTFTAVMGPSGSGKSTLLNCAAGLERPTEGTVAVGGETLTALDETTMTKLRRERVGFVFQGFHLVPYLTAEQNVALPLRLMGRRIRRGDIHAALDLVGLAEQVGRLPSELSGGQQQRVAMARAMVTGPALLCADEPTGQLDTRSAREVLGLLRGSVDRTGQTVLMVTHDAVAASYADQVVFLVDGAIVGRMSHPTVEAVATQLANLDELTLSGGVR
jgi:putative ABC transport system ATP-binding protein